MIHTFLILSCLALGDEPVRLQVALRQMDRMVANCRMSENACKAYIYQSGILDEPYKVRLKVESVEASQDEQTTIINGVVRTKHANLADYRSSAEQQAIRESITETDRMKKRHKLEKQRERVRSSERKRERLLEEQRERSRGAPPRCRRIHQGMITALERKKIRGSIDPVEKSRRQTETRARKQEHRHLIKQVNKLAEDRKDQIENVSIRILDDQHFPQHYEGKKFLNCVVRIDRFTLRPENEEIGSPPAVDKLFAQLKNVTLKKKKHTEEVNAEE